MKLTVFLNYVHTKQHIQVLLQVQAAGLRDGVVAGQGGGPTWGEKCIIEDVISTNGSHAALRGWCQG